ncbi:MAG: Na+/H+ antiporter NhaA [gamma proteobacterium symbiont of Bathyaustriella thionipta]|nr:Na+/H+ antiporter NhaA [gamma proteobacterium symbiont of Bathyaustriella thionipta]
MFERFLHSQVAGSAVLAGFAVLALVWANSPWADQYFALAKIELGFSLGSQTYTHSLGHWIKDGLMALFFFVVGLEIKRELVVGELSSIRRATLPISAALGGALLPALIYVFFNMGAAGSAGWGIPMATDIAFALGLLALFGSRVPIGLKVFLTALAIADDLLAVLVIAFFYTAEISLLALASGFIFLALIFVANRLGIRQVSVYLVLALGTWVSLEASGVHATIAGVLVALLVPVRALIGPQEFFNRARSNLARLEQSELTRESINSNEAQRTAVNEIYLAAEDITPPGIALEKQLHTIQAFLILPLFALFAAGVRFDTETLGDFPGAVALGIIMGLFFGKQIGILLASWIAVKSGAAALPAGVSWSQLWAASSLAGIGFTMSIFIGELAFSDPELISEAKIGIILASLAAGIWGAFLLNRSLPDADNS